MDSEQQDLSLSEDDAESILGGRTVAKTSTKTTKTHPGYVPGDAGVVNPTSSGMAGDASGSEDEC